MDNLAASALTAFAVSIAIWAFELAVSEAVTALSDAVLASVALDAASSADCSALIAASDASCADTLAASASILAWLALVLAELTKFFVSAKSSSITFTPFWSSDTEVLASSDLVNAFLAVIDASSAFFTAASETVFAFSAYILALKQSFL